MLREAGGLDANRFTVSAAFVLSSFIALAINDYMEANKIPKSETNGNVTIGDHAYIEMPLDL